MISAERGLIVIGTSWGGLDALSALVSALPPDFPMPMAIVQHRGRDGTGLLAELLQELTPLVVHDVEDKEPISPGHIYLAPPDYHLLVEDGYFSLSVDAPVRYSRPSIDVLFGSASESYRNGAIGVILTGANDDGARGLREIVDRGGRAIVQAPETALSPVMPRAARELVPEARVVPLCEIAGVLRTFARPKWRVQ